MTGPVTVTIPPGGSSATVRLTGIADGLDEADETVSISCAAVTGAVSAGDVLTLTLPDADPEPAAVLEVSRTTLAEGGPAAVVTASLVAVSGRDVRLTLALAGTVQASEVLLSQTELLIPAGSRSAACTLAALADTEVEAAETVVIAIAAAEHASWPPEGRTMTVTDAAAPAASETLVTGSGAGSGGGDCGSGGLAAILVGVIAMAGLRRRRSP
jgi:hypothetical protein